MQTRFSVERLRVSVEISENNLASKLADLQHLGNKLLLDLERAKKEYEKAQQDCELGIINLKREVATAKLHLEQAKLFLAEGRAELEKPFDLREKPEE